MSGVCNVSVCLCVSLCAYVSALVFIHCSVIKSIDIHTSILNKCSNYLPLHLRL